MPQLIKSQYIPSINKLFFAVNKNCQGFKIEVRPVTTPSYEANLATRYENSIGSELQVPVHRNSKTGFYMPSLTVQGASTIRSGVYDYNHWKIGVFLRPTDIVSSVHDFYPFGIYLFNSSSDTPIPYTRFYLRYYFPSALFTDWYFPAAIRFLNVHSYPIRIYSFSAQFSKIIGYAKRIAKTDISDELITGVSMNCAQGTDIYYYNIYSCRITPEGTKCSWSGTYSHSGYLSQLVNYTSALEKKQTTNNIDKVLFKFDLTSEANYYKYINPWSFNQQPVFVVENMFPYEYVLTQNNNTFVLFPDPNRNLNPLLNPLEEYIFELDSSVLPAGTNYDVYLISAIFGKNVFVKNSSFTLVKTKNIKTMPPIRGSQKNIKSYIQIKLSNLKEGNLLKNPILKTRIKIKQEKQKNIQRRIVVWNLKKQFTKVRILVKLASNKKINQKTIIRSKKNRKLDNKTRFKPVIIKYLQGPVIKHYLDKEDIYKKPIKHFTYNKLDLLRTGKGKLLLVGPVEYVIDGEEAYVKTISANSERVWRHKIVLTVPKDFSLPEDIKVFLLPNFIKMEGSFYQQESLNSVPYIDITEWLNAHEKISEYTIELINDFDWFNNDKELIKGTLDMIYEFGNLKRPMQQVLKLYVAYRSKLISNSSLNDRPVYVESISDLEKYFGTLASSQQLLVLAKEYIKSMKEGLYIWPVSASENLDKVREFLKDNNNIAYVAYADSLKEEQAKKLMQITGEFDDTKIFIATLEGNFKQLSQFKLPNISNAVVIAQKEKNLKDIINTIANLENKGNFEFLKQWPDYEEAIKLYKMGYSIKAFENEVYLQTLDKSKQVYLIELTDLQKAIRKVEEFGIRNKTTIDIEKYLSELRMLLDTLKQNLIRDYEISMDKVNENTYEVLVVLISNKLLKEVALNAVQI